MRRNKGKDGEERTASIARLELKDGEIRTVWKGW